MKSSSHHIKSKVFEVSFNDENESLRFQKSFSDFIRNELLAITEKCLAQFEGPTLKIINRLEINLGDIPYEHYERTFLERYEESLIHALFNKLEFEGPDKEEHENSIEGILFMVRHFLIKGYMPWNFDENSWESFDQMYEHAKAVDSQSLMAELDELLPDLQARIRLIHQLEEPTIQSTVKEVEPSQSQLIIDYHKTWMNTNKKHNLFGESSKQLSKSFWLFIFNYLYGERGSYFNAKVFLLSTLKQIASHFNLSFDEVIGYLRIVHKEVANTRQNDLHHLLEDMLSLDSRLIEKESVREEDDESVAQFNISDVSFFLENKRWPDGISSRRSFEEVFGQLLETSSAETIQFIRDISSNSAKVNKLLSYLKEHVVYQLYALFLPGSKTVVMSYDKFFKDHEKVIGIELGNISTIILQSLASESSIAMNHLSLLDRILDEISIKARLKRTVLIAKYAKQVEEETVSDARAEKMLKTFFSSYLADVKIEQKRLKISELDEDWIEESILKNEIHPLLEKEGFLSVGEFLRFYVKEDRGGFDSFVKYRIGNHRFIVCFVEILSIDLFEQIKPGRSFKEEKWIESFNYIGKLSTPNHIHSRAINVSLKSLVLRWMYSAVSQNVTSLEKELIGICSECSLDFNLLIKALIQLGNKTFIGEWREKIHSIASKLGISQHESEELTISVDEQLGSSDDRYLEKQLAIVISAINGIVHGGELELLGFRSADEVLRQLIKSHPGLLKERLSILKNWKQSFIGIGREIPISTFYTLLSVLDGAGGRQVTTILRKFEIQLNEGSQSINRFLNITRSLALYALSASKFEPIRFAEDFARLIKDSSPAIYTQVIPVLSKNISMISIPAKGNVDEVIDSLEEQLYHIGDSSIQMDEKVLSNLIIEEYFGQSLPKESTIIPYFDETADVVLDEIYIENSGLVILSSYFSILFERLSLLEDGKFLSPEKQEMGALFLQHLMMEQPPLNEHHLPLNKILCGLDVSHPIRTNVHVDQKSREVIHGLIDAVIGYWSAIGHSTIEGFRGSWLWRKGKLEHKEDCWELKVEQNSYDMLLDRLPFTLSPIKLSWMEKPLIVEWR